MCREDFSASEVWRRQIRQEWREEYSLSACHLKEDCSPDTSCSLTDPRYNFAEKFSSDTTADVLKGRHITGENQSGTACKSEIWAVYN